MLLLLTFCQRFAAMPHFNHVEIVFNAQKKKERGVMIRKLASKFYYEISIGVATMLHNITAAINVAGGSTLRRAWLQVVLEKQQSVWQHAAQLIDVRLRI